MGLLSTISSIFPTIGTIIGGLLGGGSNDANVIVYDFSHLLPESRQNTEGDGFEVLFTKDPSKDEYLLVNNSMNPNDAVTLTTPAMGDMDAMSLTVPGDFNVRQSVPLNTLFKENAGYDNSTLQVTASPGGTFVPVSDGAEAAPAPICMTMSGRNVLVNDTDAKKISPYLSAKLTNDTIRLTSHGGVKMSGIRNLSIEGQGDSGSVVTNVDLENPQDTVELKLPTPLISNDLADVSATVEFSSVQAVLGAQKSRGVLLQPVSGELLVRLQGAVLAHKQAMKQK